eukprot:6858328-Karenia_brevis.AAC.1
MCIRDSPRDLQETSKSLQEPFKPENLESGTPLPPPKLEAFWRLCSVSYTHLTLPTICSV